MIPTTVTNPLEGVTPSIEVFGGDLVLRLNLVVAGIWALVLVGAAVAVIIGAGRWAWAAKVTHSADGVLEGAQHFKTAAIAFGAVVGVSLILGGVIRIVQG